MIQNEFGERIYSEQEILNFLMTTPELRLREVCTTATVPAEANSLLDREIITKNPSTGFESVDEYDCYLQSQWLMPAEYQALDIAEYVLGLCRTEVELQRVGQELLLYQERDLFPFLCYLKYLVDTMKRHNLIWGVGRGSSVASYVLFLLGVHRVDAIFYDLPIDEFLR